MEISPQGKERIVGQEVKKQRKGQITQGHPPQVCVGRRVGIGRGNSFLLIFLV